MFQWLFHKQELLTTFDQKLYQDTMGKLTEAGIPFRTKWRGPASAGRQRGAMGSFGENLAYSTQYYIYVLEQDLEEAQFVLR